MNVKSRATTRRPPKLRHHHKSGQGYVKLNGRCRYLGVFGKPETTQRYHEVIAEWLAAGRQLAEPPEQITIVELADRYRGFAESYYGRDEDEPSKELGHVRRLLGLLNESHGRAKAVDFGPLALKAVREAMVAEGWCRRHVNQNVTRLKRVFRWATEQELIPSTVYHGLLAVAPLKQGRTEARESDPVRPVPRELVDPLKSALSEQVWAMIRLQLLTAARPGEICQMRKGDIDRSGKVWVYRPGKHKTAWHGHQRAIYLGPQAQKELLPFLVRPPEAYCFSPAEADTERRAALTESRTTPLTSGNEPESNRKRWPKKKPGERYTPNSYRRAIEYACDQVFAPAPPLGRREGELVKEWRGRLTKAERAELLAWRKAHRWHPHQLRHNAATELRKEFGLETARIILGHRSAAVTTIYAEADEKRAIEVIAQVGYRPFVCLIGGSQERAVELLTPIRKAILENPLLLADFPKAIHPLRCLQNNARRQIGQHIDGKATYCTWAADRLVFPTVEGSESSGAIIAVTSLDANMRGQQHTTMDGRTLRPSLVLLDDPQTRQSARSPSQTRYRLQLLTGDVLGMAGPGESIAAVLTCTKIYAGDLADQVLDRQKTPEWQGECTKLVYSFPAAEKLWDEYARVRAEGLRMGKGLKPAGEFYAARREAMDAGALVAWPERFDPKTEISAVQHAMNLKLRDEEAFAAEYQNEPVTEQFEDERLTSDEVAEKITGRSRGEVPLAATRVTAFIDVHDKLLFWCVCAWEEDFTGYVIDYGTFPDQKRLYFTQRDATHTLAATFRGAGREGAVQGGLEKLAAELLARPWARTDGATLFIERLLIDSGYLPAVANAVAIKAGPAVLLSKGMGLRAGNKPMAAYTRRPGERHGWNWYIPNVSRSSEFRHVAFDANSWKTFVHARLATLSGDKGALSLFGRKPEQHRLFAEHVADSETYVVTAGQGRTVHEWRPKPSKPDNHWFDCLVGCAVAASMAGVKAPGETAAGRQRKRYTQADLARR